MECNIISRFCNSRQVYVNCLLGNDLDLQLVLRQDELLPATTCDAHQFLEVKKALVGEVYHRATSARHNGSHPCKFKLVLYLTGV